MTDQYIEQLIDCIDPQSRSDSLNSIAKGVITLDTKNLSLEDRLNIEGYSGDCLVKGIVGLKRFKGDWTSEEIFPQVCGEFNLYPYQVEDKTRKREIVQVRQMAMYFCKMLTKDSLSTIGYACGKKDHATVLHAAKTIGNLMEFDKELRKQMIDLRSKICPHFLGDWLINN